MKKFCFALVCTLLTVVLLYSCKKEQATGCFTTSTAQPVINQSITFTDCSTGAISAAWDFGDGTTGSGIVTTKAYQTIGTYSATLISTTTSGQTTTTKKSIIVSSLPDASFTAIWCNVNASQNAVGMYDTIRFTPGAGSTSFLWNFGDGSTSHDSTPYHVYTQTGSYNVKLVAANAIGSDSSVQSVSIILPYGMYYSNLTGASATITNFTGATAGSTFSIAYQGGGSNYMYNFGISATLTGASTFTVPSQSVPLAGSGSLNGTVYGHGSFINLGTCSQKMLLVDTVIGNSGTQVLIDTL